MKHRTGFVTGAGTNGVVVNFSLKGVDPELKKSLTEIWGEDIFRPIQVELSSDFFDSGDFFDKSDFFGKDDPELTAPKLLEKYGQLFESETGKLLEETVNKIASQLSQTHALPDSPVTPRRHVYKTKKSSSVRRNKRYACTSLPPLIWPEPVMKLLRNAVAQVLLGAIASHYGVVPLAALDRFVNNRGAYMQTIFHDMSAKGYRLGFAKCDLWAYSEPDEMSWGQCQFSKDAKLIIRGEDENFYEVAVVFDLVGNPEEWAWIPKRDCVLVRLDEPSAASDAKPVKPSAPLIPEPPSITRKREDT